MACFVCNVTYCNDCVARKKQARNNDMIIKVCFCVNISNDLMHSLFLFFVAKNVAETFIALKNQEYIMCDFIP